MEITKVSQEGIKIKTKLATFAVTPIGAKGKIAVDCVLFYSRNDKVLPAFETAPLIIEGAGEYEIKGLKLTGISKKESIIYIGKIEGIDVVLMQASSAQKGKEMLNECQIAIIDADSQLDQSTIAAFNANIIVLYGAYALETSKNIEKNVINTTKYATSKDKLPGEMEVVVLT